MLGLYPTGAAPNGYSGTSSAHVVVDPRYARPQSDISTGNWAPSSGLSLSAMLSEANPDASTSITSSSAGLCELKLNAVADPQTSSGQVVRYQASSSNGGGLTVRLKQGSSVIASWTHASLPVSPTVFAQSLSAAQCDAITNYGDLRFEFEAL